ncbi:uncharacterized protein LOC107667491 [Sinocyclocheilus anshuiensis]|uniref:uncharacterized protein LOC107667491 n=1 Tax=Sinocyclocheilus anshuiensis TaxID=1608454 RepID=UPI0007BA8A89|nr:PREDICTED: uncharacterized protein LOC107667491 [Sinocyclocheilus anshuiensis]
MFEAFIFFCLCLWSLTGVFGVDEVKSVSVMEGDSVTLNIDGTDIQMNDMVEWRFGPEDILIAKISKQNNMSIFHNDSADGRFRDRLKLDHQTGSLSITNTRTTDSGVYKVTSNSTETPLNTFNLTVYAHLPIPVITIYCPQNSSSSPGSSVVSDLSISLSLPLEVEYQDKNSYSCVLNSLTSNQTTHLDISQRCHTCPDCIHCCGSTEAVIRLALSALVGVATVAVLVYEFRSSLQQKRKQRTLLSNSD